MTIVSIVGACFFLYLLIRTKLHPATHYSTLWIVSLSFLLAGTVGNLIDRVRLGYVVDFIKFDFGSYTFPIFNVADSAIVIGVILMVIDLIIESKQSQPPSPASQADNLASPKDISAKNISASDELRDPDA